MKASKIIIGAVFGLAFFWIAGQLFFEEKIESFLRPAAEKIETEKNLRTLRVAAPFEFQNKNVRLEAHELERPVYINIFEPLVRQDGNFRIEPALALSWGRRTDASSEYDDFGDDLWEFRLRPGVTFHDGSRFDAQDVIATFEYAKSVLMGGELDQILHTIESMEAVDDLTVKIRTHLGDPIFLQRLSLMLIFPSEAVSEKSIPLIGTGPYRVREWNDEKITLEKFSSYWGKKNNIEKVEISAFEEKSADLLFGFNFTPQSKIEPSYVFDSTPGLRTFYLAFNFRTPFFLYESLDTNNINQRRAFSLAIDQDAVMSAIGVFGQKANQFVPPGVFGFNPDLPPHEYNLEKAKQLAVESGLTKKTLHFVALEGMEKLGDYLAQQMSAIGVSFELIKNSPDVDFLQTSDILFAGNENIIPESSYFLESSVRNGAAANVGNYDDFTVSMFVNLSSVGSIQSRQEDLFDAMKNIVEDYPLGVPLFVQENAVVRKKSLRLPFRLDGLIYFNDLFLQ